jgi:hypothetical protein
VNRQKLINCHLIQKSAFKVFSSLNLNKIHLNYEELLSISDLSNINLVKDSLFDDINMFNYYLNKDHIKNKNLNIIEMYYNILCLQ